MNLIIDLIGEVLGRAFLGSLGADPITINLAHFIYGLFMISGFIALFIVVAS